MIAKFLDHNNRELKQRRHVAKTTEKAVGLYQQNNNSARASRFFIRFLAIVARLRRETS